MSEAATTHPVEDEPTKSQEEPGFVSLLVKSVFEPGANPAVVMGREFGLQKIAVRPWLMNTSYERVLLSPHPYPFRPRLFNAMEQARPPFARCHLTTLGIYGLVLRFVLELTHVQNRPDNMPPLIDLDSLEDSPADESKKEK
ncbi:hypothetical protein I307_03965 [Cryptococcus deuterogattii 99/473]|uniref:Uncharacterized protein n=1 Tax=Cryptococcus deuterogattii Ram5 TaxID=1296110 RepID=A0A0D0TZN2_9TREE|nr:hypothetical protein I313_02545 [Cryptococcus deuterogattii Ram5]KIY56504.1 hypothetical protein I307_03965 [Cryptococcus deuterogattii 99/473]